MRWAACRVECGIDVFCAGLGFVHAILRLKKKLIENEWIWKCCGGLPGLVLRNNQAQNGA